MDMNTSTRLNPARLSGRFFAHDPEATHRGQILIMFALFLTVMMGALGLSVDLGIAFSQRRTMQNAADAGALEGARIVAKSKPSAPLAALPHVTAVVNANAPGFGAIGAINCEYVNDGGGSLGGCGGTVPGGATGVRVTVQESHPTFFIRVVPGGMNSVSTSAVARANVRIVAGYADGPFLPCAKNTQLVGGGSMDIWDFAANKLNPAAIGQAFKIHGPQIEKCGIHPSAYKGLADQPANVGLPVAGWLNFDTGDKAGPTSADVQGADGCTRTQDPDGCVMFLPIITSKDQPLHASDHRAYAVAIVPFFVTEPKKNEHYGTPLESYIVVGGGQTGTGGWDPNHQGPIAIRLTE